MGGDCGLLAGAADRLSSKRGWAVLFKPTASNSLLDNVKFVSRLTRASGYECIYVTLNKPHSQVAELLGSEGADLSKVSFVDAVSSASGLPQVKRANLVYVNGTENLTELSLAIDALLKRQPHTKRMVFFDSLSTLLLYHSPESVARFSQFMTCKIRGSGASGALVYLEKHPGIHNSLMQFCDELVAIEG
ncbi:MAG: hypothetical protein AABW54_02710 [Candidatus Micrarchaeota archaeon]